MPDATKVLLVEDEQLVATMYVKSLRADGFEVEHALNGKKAIEVLEKWTPDLILMDIMMPEMNGIEALEKIKSDENYQKIPVVMLTNLSGKHDAEMAKKKGAVDYWVKRDVDPKQLKEMILNAVG